ncbi:hypothetical protein XENOCAPTIV_022421 [Xenoophorus captivus]|uniref:Uncharacterized protein n=1 Tax=Xenoophorus captivus TaxID=1517983 RepID=A0ABV0S924_9TELE
MTYVALDHLSFVAIQHHIQFIYMVSLFAFAYLILLSGDNRAAVLAQHPKVTADQERGQVHITSGCYMPTYYPHLPPLSTGTAPSQSGYWSWASLQPQALTRNP